MAASFAETVGPRGRVWAVDVQDAPEHGRGFRFVRVGGVELPYRDASFDVVVSNHVLEHVGDSPAQELHLREIRRVLTGDGIAYISVPNRWRIVDRHVHLPLVSWFPHPLADRYVRWTGRGEWYDVDPPSRRTMTQMLDKSDLRWEDCTLEAMRVIAEVETTHLLERLVLRAPSSLLKVGMPFVPSMIFLAWPAEGMTVG